MEISELQAETVECQASADKTNIKKTSDWLSDPPDPDNPLICNFAENLDTLAIVGAPKTGKSFLALQLAVCVATGTPFLGLECPQQKTLLVNLDNRTNQYKKRLRNMISRENLNLAPQSLRENLYIDNLNENATFESILQECLKLNCKVVIIDPFYTLINFAETDQEAVNNCLQALEKYQQNGITLVIVNTVNLIRDISYLAQYVGAILAIENHATEKGVKVVRTVNRNYKPLDDFAVRFSGGAFTLAPVIF